MNAQTAQNISFVLLGLSACILMASLVLLKKARRHQLREVAIENERKARITREMKTTQALPIGYHDGYERMGDT